MKKALITGITGQDGSYLAELLIAKGYQVHGMKRRSSLINTQRINHIYEEPHHRDVKLLLHHGDMTDGMNIARLLQAIEPDEIYNLAAMSHVHVSFETPEYTGNVDALGTLRILEAVRFLGLEKKTRIYHASTSELFGKVQETPQTEETPFYPRSPYAVAKVYAYWITRNYREAYHMHASNGILFNHESPRRGETFVTRKITRGLAQIVAGLENNIYLGNLDAKRDWGHARDYVRGMWMILQQDVPDDYVLATGETRSVRDFADIAFRTIGINLAFTGKGVDEKGYVADLDEDKFAAVLEKAGVVREAVPPTKGQCVIEVDPYYFRPTEVDLLLGNPAKVKRVTGWQPEISFEQMVDEMVIADLGLFLGAGRSERRKRRRK